MWAQGGGGGAKRGRAGGGGRVQVLGAALQSPPKQWVLCLGRGGGFLGTPPRMQTRGLMMKRICRERRGGGEESVWGVETGVYWMIWGCVLSVAGGGACGEWMEVKW